MSLLYLIMGYGGLTGAIICLLIAVVLFIRWNIPKVIGDMTGGTQRRAIARIKEERHRVMKMHDDMMNAETETIRAKVYDQTDRQTNGSGPITAVLHGEEKTMPLNSVEEEITDVLTSNVSDRNNVTVKISNGEPTTSVLNSVLPDDDTGELQQTAIDYEAETTVLGSGNNREIIILPNEAIQESGKIIQILELIVVHTNEMIG